MAHRDDPRNNAGVREVERSETRMSGVLSLCTSKEKVTRRKAETSCSSQKSAAGVRSLMGIASLNPSYESHTDNENVT